MITTYRIEEITDMEDFLNKVYIGLKHYEKNNKNIKVKITHTEDTVTIKTLVLDNEQLN